jgi:hypothetical protein
MLHGAIRTITLNPQPGSAQGGVSYSGWLLGSVVPMWLMTRAAFASWRLMWRVGRRRHQTRGQLSQTTA